jgi:hypothetical protein
MYSRNCLGVAPRRRLEVAELFACQARVRVQHDALLRVVLEHDLVRRTQRAHGVGQLATTCTMFFRTKLAK